jgi:hypothetical protein
VTNRLVAKLGTSGGDLLVFAFALIATLASFWNEDPAAYAFPRLVCVLMLALSSVNLVRRAMAGFSGEPAITWALARKIAPGIAVCIVYLLAARALGFYLSALLAFFAVSFLYSAHRRPGRIAIVTGAVVAVLYLMFSVVLKVQVPREFFL